MVKRGEKSLKSNPSAAGADPETKQKQRLRSLAVTNNLLSRSPARAAAPLPPSRALVKLDGRDVVKRGQRKSRFLFSFPGLLAPLSGGRIGELADLGSKNPVLYLEFPTGRMKLFGTHVYPKNKYLTLQLTRSAKGVTCEDCFESLIVFSEAWWIGSKEDNPEEHRLEFPKEIHVSTHEEPDFKGGAGATFEEASTLKKPTRETKEKSPSPDRKSEEYVDSESDACHFTRKSVMIVPESTPVRHSARMAGKTLSFAESSGTDSDATDEDQEDVKADDDSKRYILDEQAGSSVATSNLLAPLSTLADKKKVEQSSSSKKLEKSEEHLPVKKGALVQPTLSTLFEKAAGKKTKRSANESPGPKEAKRQRVDSDQLTLEVQVKGSNKKEVSSRGKTSGTRTVSVKRKAQVADDDTEDISSDSQDDDDSPQDDDDDEDWAESE